MEKCAGGPREQGLCISTFQSEALRAVPLRTHMGKEVAGFYN